MGEEPPYVVGIVHGAAQRVAWGNTACGMGQHSVSAWGSIVWWHRAAQHVGIGQHSVWHGAAQCGGMGQRSVVAWGSAVWQHRAAQCGGIGQHSVAA